MSYSFQIAGSPNFDCLIKLWPVVKIEPGIVWQSRSNGDVIGLDRGVACIEWTSQITFRGSLAYIQSLQTFLETNCREGATLTNFQTDIFGPLVDYTNPIQATIRPDAAAQKMFASDGSVAYYELKASIRAQQVLYVSTSPSLSALRLQNDFQSDKAWSELTRESYTQVPTFANPLNEKGVFGPAKFSQSGPEAQAILNYILIQQRALPFAFPTLPGVTYPFGATQPPWNDCNCVVTAVTIQRLDLSRYGLAITFSQTGIFYTVGTAAVYAVFISGVGSGDVPEIGMKSGSLMLITGRPGFAGSTALSLNGGGYPPGGEDGVWYEGLLAEDALGTISQRVEPSNGGSYGAMSGTTQKNSLCAYVSGAVETFTALANANSLNFHRRRVQIFAVFGTEFYPCGLFLTDGITWNDQVFAITYIDPAILHKDVPQNVVIPAAYPYAPVDSQNKPIPLTIGRVRAAELVPVTDLAAYVTLGISGTNPITNAYVYNAGNDINGIWITINTPGMSFAVNDPRLKGTAGNPVYCMAIRPGTTPASTVYAVKVTGNDATGMTHSGAPSITNMTTIYLSDDFRLANQGTITVAAPIPIDTTTWWVSLFTISDLEIVSESDIYSFPPDSDGITRLLGWDSALLSFVDVTQRIFAQYPQPSAKPWPPFPKLAGQLLFDPAVYQGPVVIPLTPVSALTATPNRTPPAGYFRGPIPLLITNTPGSIPPSTLSPPLYPFTDTGLIKINDPANIDIITPSAVKALAKYFSVVTSHTAGKPYIYNAVLNVRSMPIAADAAFDFVLPANNVDDAQSLFDNRFGFYLESGETLALTCNLKFMLPGQNTADPMFFAAQFYAVLLDQYSAEVLRGSVVSITSGIISASESGTTWPGLTPGVYGAQGSSPGGFGYVKSPGSPYLGTSQDYTDPTAAGTPWTLIDIDPSGALQTMLQDKNNSRIVKTIRIYFAASFGFAFQLDGTGPHTIDGVGFELDKVSLVRQNDPYTGKYYARTLGACTVNTPAYVSTTLNQYTHPLVTGNSTAIHVNGILATVVYAGSEAGTLNAICNALKLLPGVYNATNNGSNQITVLTLAPIGYSAPVITIVTTGGATQPTWVVTVGAYTAPTFNAPPTSPADIVNYLMTVQDGLGDLVDSTTFTAMNGIRPIGSTPFNQDWSMGKQLVTVDNNFQIISDIMKHAFCFCVPGNDGKRRLVPGDYQTRGYGLTIDTRSAINGSIGDAVISGLDRLYTHFLFNYDYNPASGGYNVQFGITDAALDLASFPLETDMVPGSSPAMPTWKTYAIGYRVWNSTTAAYQDDYGEALGAWTKCKAAYTLAGRKNSYKLDLPWLGQIGDWTPANGQYDAPYWLSLMVMDYLLQPWIDQSVEIPVTPDTITAQLYDNVQFGDYVRTDGNYYLWPIIEKGLDTVRQSLTLKLRRLANASSLGVIPLPAAPVLPGADLDPENYTIPMDMETGVDFELEGA